MRGSARRLQRLVRARMNGGWYRNHHDARPARVPVRTDARLRHMGRRRAMPAHHRRAAERETICSAPPTLRHGFRRANAKAQLRANIIVASAASIQSSPVGCSASLARGWTTPGIEPARRVARSRSQQPVRSGWRTALANDPTTRVRSRSTGAAAAARRVSPPRRGPADNDAGSGSRR